MSLMLSRSVAVRHRRYGHEGTALAPREEISVRPNTICVHSDLPRAVDLAAMVRRTQDFFQKTIDSGSPA